MDPAEIAPVQALKEQPPNTLGELSRILGFLNYYRAYIPDFSKVVKPLYKLLTMLTQGLSLLCPILCGLYR